MYRTDDPHRDFDRYDAECAKYEARLPHCEYCGEAIHERYYVINDEIICEECLEQHFGHRVEDYLED